MTIEIMEEKLDGSHIKITILGRLNAITAPEFKERLKYLASEGFSTQLLDLTAVTFIDSSGLAALVSGLRATRDAGGTMLLVGLNERTIAAFRLSRLDRLFNIYEDLDAAIAALPVVK